MHYMLCLDYIKLLNNKKWKPFNLFVANNKKAYWVKSTEKDKISVNMLSEGKHFLDSYDLNSSKSERFLNNNTKFQSLNDPNPDKCKWEEWINFLANKSYPKDKPLAAMNITDEYKNNYGTLSSSIIALPSDNELHKNIKPLFLAKKSPCGLRKPNAKIEALLFLSILMIFPKELSSR